MNQSPQPEFERPLIRRAHIAVLLSGIFASFAVAFIAFIWISIWTGLTGGGAAPHYQAELDASYVFLERRVDYLISIGNELVWFCFSDPRRLVHTRSVIHNI